MRTTGIMAIGLALSLAGTGCATKKYVAKTVAPVEQRVSGTEGKNTEQDKSISAQGGQIETIDRDLSRTKEKLNDTDAKAAQANEAARMADQKAAGAQQSADGARQAAEGAHTFAEQGLNRLGKNMEAMNNYQMAKTESILFGFNQDTLTKEAMAKLDEIGNDIKGKNRYIVEVQGFTDKVGSPAYNNMLSERRAAAVARHLANKYQIPVHSISILGLGYGQPAGDDKTRDGRKMNRRVEVRLWVPESDGTNKTTASNQPVQ